MKQLAMKVSDQDGSMLDAEFEVVPSDAGADIVLLARYGGRQSQRKRNVDYFPALELLLTRLSAIGAVIESASVDSTVALKLPAEQRALILPYPILLTHETDPAELRLAMTRAQRTVARAVEAQPVGGNNHKRIRISARWDDPSIDVGRLASLLQFGSVRPVAPVLGTSYRPAAANPSVAPADVFTLDPATLERALANHASIQNTLAAFLRSRGLEPRSPRAGEPDFDIAWLSSDVFVAEVKSLAGTDEDRQLRLGLGQVLHYRYLLTEMYGSAKAVLAVETAPSPIWRPICAGVDVILSWPPGWPGLP